MTKIKFLKFNSDQMSRFGFFLGHDQKMNTKNEKNFRMIQTQNSTNIFSFL